MKRTGNVLITLVTGSAAAFSVLSFSAAAFAWRPQVSGNILHSPNQARRRHEMGFGFCGVFQWQIFVCECDQVISPAWDAANGSVRRVGVIDVLDKVP